MEESAVLELWLSFTVTYVGQSSFRKKIIQQLLLIHKQLFHQT